MCFSNFCSIISTPCFYLFYCHCMLSVFILMFDTKSSITKQKTQIWLCNWKYFGKSKRKTFARKRLLLLLFERHDCVIGLCIGPLEFSVGKICHLLLLTMCLVWNSILEFTMETVVTTFLAEAIALKLMKSNRFYFDCIILDVLVCF